MHGVDETDEVVLTRRFIRRKLPPFFAKLPSCLIGMETCASAHHLARELVALGHGVRLMPPVHAMTYVKCQAIQDRCRRCGSDLPSGIPAEHTVRAGQVTAATKPPDAPSHVITYRALKHNGSR